MARFFYHRLRGEEETARELWNQTELSYLQLGSAWIFESQRAWISAVAYGLSRDVIGLKRTIVELERLCRAGYRLDAFLEITRGEYLRERGDLEGAVARCEAALAFLQPDETYVRQLALAALAETHLAAGRSRRALKIGREGFELASQRETRCETTRLRCGRAMALAQAARGKLHKAEQMLEQLLADALPLASPTLSGGLHEARARVALLAGDQPTYLHHAHQAGQYFRGTKNPALVARIERLELAAKEIESGPQRVVAEDAVTVVARTNQRSRITKTLASCRGSAERAERALELLIDEAFADSGYLFLQGAEGLTLAAPSYGAEPAESVLQRVDQAFAGHDDELTQVMGESCLTILLPLGDERGTIIGVAHLEGGSLPLRRPLPEVAERIARTLYEAGDATSMPSQGPPSLSSS